MLINPCHNKISFGSNDRTYCMPSGRPIRCYTSFFRADLDWNRFAEFLGENFKDKNKVNVINSACSDGSEAYSLIIALKEFLSSDDCKKFLPIKASDYDAAIVDAAKSGMVLAYANQIPKINTYVNNCGDYFEKSNSKILKIEGDNAVNYRETLVVKDNLLKEVDFEQKGVFEILKSLEDDSNTVLMFRNALGHLKDRTAKSFAQKASEKLHTGSVVVIGSFDRRQTKIVEYLQDVGFVEVFRNVFRKNEIITSHKTKIIQIIKSLFLNIK